MISLNPVRVLKDEADEEKCEIARLSIYAGAIAIGDLVKSTLGPKGMDKILISGGRNTDEIRVTNDGATILKSVGVDNPAAKILVNMSKVQDDEVGDGTTSVTVFAAELLRESEKLINLKIHPQTIISGWRQAVQVAKNSLIESAIEISSNQDEFRADLLNIARTTLSSKILAQHKDLFSDLAVQAVLRLKGLDDLKAIHIIKIRGGMLHDSFLDEGFLLQKQVGTHQPKRIEKARILVANTAMDTDKIKVFGSRMKVDSMAKVSDLEAAEKEKMRDKVNKILKHDINVFVNRQLIYNYPEQLFADAGIMAIEHADFDGIERLALVTGGDVISMFDTPETVKLGTCDLVEQIMIGEESLIRFSGVPLGQACTIVIRGSTQQIMDEAERSLHDALCVLMATVKESRKVYGGGASEMLMSCAISKTATETQGIEALAMEAFSKALQQLPLAIADNAGYDSASLVNELRFCYNKGMNTMGIDMNTGKVACMRTLGIVESLAVKRQILISAAEAAEMILRVDGIIKAAPRKRVEDRGYC